MHLKGLCLLLGDGIEPKQLFLLLLSEVSKGIESHSGSMIRRVMVLDVFQSSLELLKPKHPLLFGLVILAELRGEINESNLFLG